MYHISKQPSGVTFLLWGIETWSKAAHGVTVDLILLWNNLFIRTVQDDIVVSDSDLLWNHYWNQISPNFVALKNFGSCSHNTSGRWGQAHLNKHNPLNVDVVTENCCLFKKWMQKVHFCCVREAGDDKSVPVHFMLASWKTLRWFAAYSNVVFIGIAYLRSCKYLSNTEESLNKGISHSQAHVFYLLSSQPSVLSNNQSSQGLFLGNLNLAIWVAKKGESTSYSS